MREIIKMPRKAEERELKIFTCGNCGCQFSADRYSFEYDFDIKKNKSVCPCCDKECYIM